MAIRTGLWLYRHWAKAGQTPASHAHDFERSLDSGVSWHVYAYEDAQCEFPERLVAEWLAEAIDAGLSDRQPLEEALAAYEQTRNQAELPYFDLTTQLAALEPPPPEVQQLLEALRENPEQRSRFFGMLAHTVPVTEFFSPENMQKIFEKHKVMAASM